MEKKIGYNFCEFHGFSYDWKNYNFLDSTVGITLLNLNDFCLSSVSTVRTGWISALLSLQP